MIQEGSRYELEKLGVFFMDTRSNGQRFIRVEYHEPERETDGSDASDGSDATAPASEICGTFVPDGEENGRPEISETVDTIGVEVHPDASVSASEDSDASCHSDASGSRADEMDPGWVEEIRTALGVTHPISQPDIAERGERNEHPFAGLHIEEEISA